MKNLNKAIELHEKADKLLRLSQSAKKKYESMLRYNVEIAEPNGFDPHCTSSIDITRKASERLYYSYQKCLIKILEL